MCGRPLSPVRLLSFSEAKFSGVKNGRHRFMAPIMNASLPRVCPLIGRVLGSDENGWVGHKTQAAELRKKERYETKMAVCEVDNRGAFRPGFCCTGDHIEQQ